MASMKQQGPPKLMERITRWIPDRNAYFHHWEWEWEGEAFYTTQFTSTEEPNKRIAYEAADRFVLEAVAKRK